ncbi:MAG: endonuclease [Candidatus Taylorbacteria bacterium CG10_big_fil_rev_8_21_14_0_10_41_48]|uniref:Endonuclease n=1 Tax=Candidatus Taylorbacteria bacterium CG10_big_fil_rev_8_21_14_0_10_41_48 TaxID=1975024 RepID=A0A2M8LBP3_9BACT|nr:MAG: endonuclease [Candidatus Taylorbacteria bacterium CG10_big_fil_rev_8_21_14_0_10_41_48]
MYFVYIIKCKDKSLYTGITTDVERRLAEHREGRGARYTRVRGVLRVVYTERYNNRSLASKREIEIKKLSRAEKLNLIKS